MIKPKKIKYPFVKWNRTTRVTKNKKKVCNDICVRLHINTIVDNKV